jgi:hypothetical protein
VRAGRPGQRLVSESNLGCAVLSTDASEVAVAAILTQPDDEGRQHPVAYKSRKLTWTAAEWNHSTPHVLELLAVVHARRASRGTA